MTCNEHSKPSKVQHHRNSNLLYFLSFFHLKKSNRYQNISCLSPNLHPFEIESNEEAESIRRSRKYIKSFKSKEGSRGKAGRKIDEEEKKRRWRRCCVQLPAAAAMLVGRRVPQRDYGGRPGPSSSSSSSSSSSFSSSSSSSSSSCNKIGCTEER